MKPPWSVEELVATRAWLLHPETGFVGQAKVLHPAGEWVSLGNGKPVNAPVIEFESGDTLVVKADAFVPLTAGEESVYVEYVKMLTATTQLAGRYAASAKLDMGVFATLAGAALRVQAAQLEAVVLEERERAKEKAKARAERFEAALDRTLTDNADLFAKLARVDIERTPSGDINNCALANGAPEAECQMCPHACPDRARFP